MFQQNDHSSSSLRPFISLQALSGTLIIFVVIFSPPLVRSGALGDDEMCRAMARDSKTSSPTKGPQRGVSKERTSLFSARHVTWDQRSLTLSARSDVSFKQGELSLTCQSAKVLFTTPVTHSSAEIDRPLTPWSGATLRELHASGGVSVQFRSLRLKAVEVTYDHTTQTITARGPISGSWGDARLSGASLTISLLEKRVYAQEAKLKVSLPSVIPIESAREPKITLPRR